MKKILSALLATATIGAMTVAASAQNEAFEIVIEGMTGAISDVVTADGFDSFTFVWEKEGCASTCTYYFPEGGVYSHYKMELYIPEGITLEHYNKEMGFFFTEDQLTAIDEVTYSVNEDALPMVVGHEELTAEEARQFNINLIIGLDDMIEEDGDTTDIDNVTEDTSGTDSADDSEKASADTGVHGTVALGVAIAAAGALVLSKKRA